MNENVTSKHNKLSTTQHIKKADDDITLSTIKFNFAEYKCLHNECIDNLKMVQMLRSAYGSNCVVRRHRGYHM